MATSESKQAVVLPLSQERRRHQRVKLSLLGRYMLEDRKEYPCQTLDMSPGGAALITTMLARVGEHVVAYIDHLGRLEGRCVRHIDNGFAMTIAGTARRRDKLADQLTWFANRQILGMPEDRRHDRFSLKNPLSTLDLADRGHRALQGHRRIALGRLGHGRRAVAGRLAGHARPHAGARRSSP